MKPLRHLYYLFIILVVASANAQVALNPDPMGVVDIPDPNLKAGIRDALSLPAGNSITQQEMLHLTRLAAGGNGGITDLTGLQHATNITYLYLWGNPIFDLSPLSNLTELKELDLGGCQIVDITPLANLRSLERLNIRGNQIVDISPLTNLTQLRGLWINGNPIRDYSPLDGLSLTVLERDEVCELPALPIEQRLKSRTFPSVFSAWDGIRTQNRPDLSKTEKLALHDLHWHTPYFGLHFSETPDGWKLVGNLEYARDKRDEMLALNPNMIFITGVSFRDAFPNAHPQDWPYWLRDESGNRVLSPSGDTFLTDFTLPGLQDIIVEQAIAVAQCGLFDGIFLDWFHEHFDVLPGYYSLEEELRAKDTILQRIRGSVRDDFLVIINTNRATIPRKAWGINGTFMETLRDNQWNSDPKSYTHEGIKEIEDTLLWSEENLREPQINCLEGWGIPDEPPDSLDNLRFMRVFTTMSLTLSDGYVSYTIENTHIHFWHSFWDADLGRPVGPKAQPYEDIEGLYIREFTNGWAVYNRSGKAQPITLPRVATAVGNGDLRSSTTHLLPDLDGEIYLRVGKPYDLNRDGTVNILDLILVSQHLGTTDGDINGDGTTNILDLTIVVQQFSK